ncbi:uncharacterized protein EV422DRAFT_511050 [Fimicolochytrium jonesii]|uniref:uncharacterized protein n=1 Tax=Fimicolochytrium jonesii TaxID=1396493 RepID=UPI0022FE5BC1|nr:uncharacterized protein EV422DRAFT_511050 [Fimicolochytrium jonesii]KAI8826679.1 hypothetical protein EV422DRAFT_511050 [Fimicolochytrium jonesii]
MNPRTMPRIFLRPPQTLLLTRAYSTSKPFEQPGPLPLGDKADQKEFEELVKQKLKQQESGSNTALHPDAPKKLQEAEWEGDKNPVTGEIGGPKGKEPTRYGDWERKGRVYDF